MFFRWGLALFLLLAPASAGAASWSWPAGEARRYRLQSYMVLPAPYLLMAERNTEVRATAWHLDLVSTCTRQGEGEPWLLRCTVDADALVLGSAQSDGEAASLVAREWAERLAQATITLSLDPEGRLLTLDLEGVSKADQRQALIHETLRLFLTRAFAGFDLTLPADTRSPWVQRQSALNAFPWPHGDTRSTRLRHHEPTTDGERLVVVSEGTGRLAPGETDFLFALDIASQATLEGGAMVSRTWTVLGTPTSGSQAPPEGRHEPYVQAGWLVRVGDEAPQLGASGSWDEAFVEGPAWRAMREVYAGPAGPVTVRRVDQLPRFAWVELGSALVADGGDLGPGLHLGGGLRWHPGLWSGVRLRAPLSVGQGELGDTELDHDLYTLDPGVGAWWAPAWRVAPRGGLLGGAELRHYTEASPAWIAVPYGAVELAVQVCLARGWYLDAYSQGRGRLREVRVREGQSGDTWSTSPVAGELGLSLVVGVL